jgi:hypothetical protein
VEGGLNRGACGGRGSNRSLHRGLRDRFHLAKRGISNDYNNFLRKKFFKEKERATYIRLKNQKKNSNI